MKEQVVSFEVAKLAKEKEFDLSTLNYYVNIKTPNSNTNIQLRKNGYNEFILNGINNNSFKARYSAPTQSLLQKWLREKHKIYISVLPRFCDITCDLEGYYYYIENEYGAVQNEDEILNKIYEEALESGLQLALKLIENGK